MSIGKVGAFSAAARQNEPPMPVPIAQARGLHPVEGAPVFPDPMIIPVKLTTATAMELADAAELMALIYEQAAVSEVGHGAIDAIAEAVGEARMREKAAILRNVHKHLYARMVEAANAEAAAAKGGA